MATSYYKFGERPEVSGVDWGKIGSDLTKQIGDETIRREELKVEIDKSSNDYVRGFNEMPQGIDQGANERMSAFADDASQYMLMLNKKLKAGQIKLRDYSAMKANLEQGTTDMFSVSEKYNTDFEETMTRASNGDASALEVWNNSNLQKFANPSASGIYINPTTGQISMAKMIVDENGIKTMSQDPNDLSSIFSLKNKQTQKIDRLDVGKWAENQVASFQNKHKAVFLSNDVGTIESLLGSEKFLAAKKGLIEAKLKETYAGQSILADGGDEEYRYSKNPDDEGKEDVIFLAPDPDNPNSGVLIPHLTTNQYDKAYKRLEEQIDGRLGYEETISEDVDRAQKQANLEESQQSIDYFNDTKDIKIDALLLKNDTARQHLAVIAAKTPLELESMGLSNAKIDQLIKHLAKKNVSELKTMDLSIENTEAIMGERATKHESDMAAAKTKQEKAQIELEFTRDNEEYDVLIKAAQLKKINKPTQWEAKDKEEKKLVSNYVSKIGHVFDGSESQIDAALNYISNANRDITSIERNNDEVVIEMFDVDGKTSIVKRIPIDNKRDFVESMSALVANELNVVDIMDDMGYDDQGTYTDYNASSEVQTTEAKEAGYKKEISVIVDTAISRDLFHEIDKEADFKTELLRLTEKGGSLEAFDDIKIETSKDSTGKIISNELYISFPDEKTSITIDTNNWTDSGDTDQMKILRDFLKDRGRADASGLAKFYGFDNKEYVSPDEVDYTTGIDYTKI